MAVLHLGFTVIACRGSWTNKRLPKNHWWAFSCEIKQTPHERLTQSKQNQSQWFGTQMKKGMDLPQLLFDWSTSSICVFFQQIHISCGKKICVLKTNLLRKDASRLSLRFTHHAFSTSLCCFVSWINGHFLLCQPWALFALWDSLHTADWTGAHSLCLIGTVWRDGTCLIYCLFKFYCSCYNLRNYRGDLEFYFSTYTQKI